MTAKSPATNTTLDRWAIFVSGLCVVHCLAIPVTVLLMPAVSGPLAHEQTTVHWLLLAVAVPISLLALGSGYRRHGHAGTLMIGLVGLVLLTVGVAHWLGEHLEVPLTLLGGLALIVAHLRNLRHQH